MTVAAGYRDYYISDGVLTSFDFTFGILDETHLRVYYNDGSAETELALDSGYTVSDGPWPEGGTITLVDGALTAGYVITILRNVPLTQDTDLKNQSAFYRGSVETALDKAVMMIQQQQETLDRTAKITPSTLAFDATIPSPQPGKVLRCKIDASGFEWVDVPDSVIAVGYPIAVGGIYHTVSTGNPATELGYGSWSLIAAGRVLVGQNGADANFDTLEETGGAATVTLDVNQIPAHAHAITDPGHSHGVTDAGHDHDVTDPGHTHAEVGVAAGTGLASGANFEVANANVVTEETGVTVDSATTGITVNSASSGFAQTDGAGGGLPHTNLQPYFVVRFWKRTA